RARRVLAYPRTPASLQEISSPAKVSPLALDVTQPGAAARAVEQVLDRDGRLDALVSNAGYGQYGAVEDVSLEDWRRQFDVNLFGALEAARAALPPMRKARRGTIVFVSSVAGRISIPF